MREGHMQSLRSRGPRRFHRVVTFLAVVTIVSGLSSAFLPSVDRVALAREGQALGDTLILAGPGGQYGILTVAPAGASISVDGDPVDGYYPVTYDGISGWTSSGLLQLADGGTGSSEGPIFEGPAAMAAECDASYPDLCIPPGS